MIPGGAAGFECISGDAAHIMACKTDRKGGLQMPEENHGPVEGPAQTGDDVDDYIFKSEQDWLTSDR